ncbi:MAG: hypothetical protein ACI9HX_001090 [Pseudoalteromonas tetraodonis]|jgi:hypothetical protein
MLSKSIKWIMLVSGLLTCTMIYAVISPEASVASTFGESLSGDLANTIVRSWGALITLIGVMLIYGAFNPSNRKFAAAIAGVSKLIYVALLINLGDPYLSKAAVIVGFDSIVAVVLLAYVFVGENDS